MTKPTGNLNVTVSRSSTSVRSHSSTALLRTLDAGRTSCTRPPTVPSEEVHAQTLNSHDASRLNLMKSINDAEGGLAGKEASLARLKEECLKLEASDPAAEHELDATSFVASFECMIRSNINSFQTQAHIHSWPWL